LTALADRLAEFPFFGALDARTRTRIAERGAWFSLAGGWDLFHQGGQSRTLFFVLSGRLIVVRRIGDEEQVVGYVRAGEPVGEMSLLSGEPHSASVYALRDAEILALAADDAAALMDRDADLAIALSRSILERARRPHSSFQRAPARVMAFIGTSPAVDVDARAHEVSRAAAALGERVCALTEADADISLTSFETIEETHDFVIIAARVADSPWYKFALRHADRFFVLARRDAKPARPFPLSLEADSPARRFRLVDLVVIHEGAASSTVREWSAAISANRVFHWVGPEAPARLARVVSGRTLGLVLSGGGARAYAHIGAIRALRQAGLPIDFIGGASMGAIVGACAALGWSDAEIEARIRDGFVSSNPLGDHVLPVVALTRGRRVEERLEKHFGSVLIEDMPTPFYCVSSELTLGRITVHREGLLRAALRASISLPGLLPPVVDGERLYVDGAVVDNFPTDVMAGLHRGVTIGVDVAREASINPADFVNPPGFFDWVRQHGIKTAPPIVTLLMRASIARRNEPTGKSRPPDILVTPPVVGVQLRDWKRFDAAVEDGYRSMATALEANEAKLAPLRSKTKG
jgi:NTE family protein